MASPDHARAVACRPRRGRARRRRHARRAGAAGGLRGHVRDPTPARARLRRDAHAPEFDSTTFRNTAGYDELVLVSDIPVRSLCEHHLLPFTGLAHVGYLPGDRILGLSKFARTVEFFARRAQTQERLTTEIADHLLDRLQPHGVGVVVEADHTCMTLRGARAEGARTVTAALRGRLREDPATRAEFLSLTRDRAAR